MIKIFIIVFQGGDLGKPVSNSSVGTVEVDE